MSDPTRIVTRLRTLAQEYENRPIIVRRGVLPSLVNFLNHENPEIQTKAAETLLFLSIHPENKEAMHNEPNLVDELCKIMQSQRSIRDIAKDVLVNLAEYITDENIAKYECLKTVVQSVNRQEAQRRRKLAKLGKKKNLVLSVEKLNNEEARRKIQTMILNCKGTISYTMNVPHRRVDLYTRSKTKFVLEMFEKEGFPAQLISKEVCSTEPIKRSDDKENRRPKYLQNEKKVSYIMNVSDCISNHRRALIRRV